ncbi:MADS-box protein CMB1-like [Phalaenopsis equestris]|uniref:MADS-box protein CMB1-like n=1 Tax=Phalaenopsis equestris TaxID=78828 RepID=UPI0009E4EC6F|nr:MADS-box protein CMB1-like [Phalaenopsis equestris]
MGRGRVELKRIENKINRQVTFAKRRNGLLKKAYELSVLCDAEVALIVFSNRGRLFEFCSSSSMTKTLERYQKCSYNATESTVPSKDTQNSYQEYLKLKTKVEYLQRSQRNLLGEDLIELGSKELEQLELQLEMSLKQIRSTKTQLMLDQLCDLKRKEQMLQEANRALRRKLQEDEPEIPLELSWTGGGGNGPCERQQPQSEDFFQPLPSLQIGFSPICIDQQLNTELRIIIRT